MRRLGYDKELVLWCEYSAHNSGVWECKNIDCQINRDVVAFKYEKGEVFEVQMIIENEVYFEPIYVDTRMFQRTAVDALDNRYYVWRLQPQATKKYSYDYDVEAKIDIDMKNNTITMRPYISDFMYQNYESVEYSVLVKRIQ